MWVCGSRSDMTLIAGWREGEGKLKVWIISLLATGCGEEGEYPPTAIAPEEFQLTAGGNRECQALAQGLS